MKQQNRLEQLIRQELRQGHSKKSILSRLSTEYDRNDLLFYLNTFPDEQQRRQNLWINHFLCILLLVVTLKKLYFMAMLQITAIATEQFSILLLLDLIVPMINFYVLSKLIHFHRQGYQFMTALGLLALVRPENRVMPDLAMYLVVTALAAFLLLRLFPNQERLKE
jgi:hypothetical protein